VVFFNDTHTHTLAHPFEIAQRVVASKC
jgi:hypothetical protein